MYQASPVISSTGYSGRPAYTAAQPTGPVTTYVPAAYQSQYRLASSRNLPVANRTKRNAEEVQDCDENYNVRFGGKGIPVGLKGHGAGQRQHILGVSA